MQQRKLRLGAAWHPEHWPRSIWKDETARMHECGLEVVRMAEFSWSHTQPRKGVWEWDWLDEAVEAAAGAELDIILCTPSACPPPWLIAEDPTILPILADGTTLGLGHRRHYSPHHEGYRSTSADFARRLAERYGAHPRVMGFQVDNELCGILDDTGPLAAAAFRAWLRERHGTLEALWENLGLVFWGQRFSDWDQIPVPTPLRHQPSLLSEFSRFSASAWTRFCRAQADVIRAVGHGKPITTNCYLFRWGMEIDWRMLMREGGLDVFSFDNYSEDAVEETFYHDLARSLSNPYWILEQPAGSPFGQNLWPNPVPTIPEAAERAARSGAGVATYFCWRQPLFGKEQDHGAVVDHTGRPGPVFEQVRLAAAELNRLEQLRELTPPVPRVGVSFLWEDAWLGEWTTYRDLVMRRVHAGCQEAGERVRFVLESEGENGPAGLDLLILPYRAGWSASWEKAILDVIETGGRVLAMPMLFAKDTFNKYRPEFLTPALQRAFGVEVGMRIPVRKEAQAMGRLEGGPTVASALWLEELRLVNPDKPGSGATLGDAEVLEILGVFEDGPIAGSPLLTRLRHAGGGQALFLAGYPDAAGMAAVIRKALE